MNIFAEIWQGGTLKWGRLAMTTMVVWSIGLGIVAISKIARPEKHTVYALFQDTGHRWLAGENIYASKGTYRYSPLAAAYFAQMSRLPLTASSLIWLGVNAWVFFWGFLWWTRVALPWPRNRDFAAILLLLCLPLVLGNFHNLQANPMMMGFMLASICAVLERKWWTAACVLAISAHIKVYPLALAMVLLVLYPRPLWWRLGLALAARVLLPFLTQHSGYVIQMYQNWPGSIAGDHRLDRDFPKMYRSLALLWRFYIDNGPINVRHYQVVQALGAALVGLATLWTRRVRMQERDQLMFLLGLVIGWMMLLGPSTESVTYMLLAPTTTWLLLETMRRRDRPTLMRPILAASYVLLLSAVFGNWFPSNGQTWGVIVETAGVQPIAAALVTGCFLAWGCKFGRRGTCFHILN